LLLLYEDDVVHVHVAIFKLPIIVSAVLTCLARNRGSALAIDHLDVTCCSLQVLFQCFHLGLLQILQGLRIVHGGYILILQWHWWLDDLVLDVDLSKSECIVVILLVSLGYR
jgi:hypothetical protein